MAKTKPKLASRTAQAMEAKSGGFFSLDIQTGVEKLRPEDLLQREAPGSKADAAVRARAWHTDNWFVEQVCRFNACFYNFGLEIKPARANAKRPLAALQEDKREWNELLRYIRTVWAEWVMQDTVVSFWRVPNGDAPTSKPFLLLPETCDYSDAFGIEKMRVAFNYTKKDLEDEGKFGIRGLNPSLVERYSKLNNKILLSEEHGEFFRVLTRQIKGQGFGWPRLRRVFRTLGQCESMEVGEYMYALAGRLVVREQKIGFEVRSGANAMRQEAYLWKKKRSDALQQFFQGRNGLVDTIQQFDHDWHIFWTDPKNYDFRKWQTVVDRMLWWGGPAAFLLLARQLPPYLLQMLMQSFETLAQEERQMVGAHLEEVIQQGWGLPVKLEWSNQCFRDLRLAWDMMKFYTLQGPLSLRTGLEAGGWDLDTELGRKKEERKHEADLSPLYDPHHGNRPGDVASGKAGRPTGKKTGTDREANQE